MKAIYDNIGIGYSKHRCADPRIVEAIIDLIGLSIPATLAEIGAGTGNYSFVFADLGFRVLAVEPSVTMGNQARPHVGIEWHFGTAEHIPLKDGSVDGVVCILAAHHFSSLEAAVSEMARICSDGPIVWFTFDPRKAESCWLHDYFPAVWETSYKIFPPIEDLYNLIETYSQRSVSVTSWPIPHDLQDCFMAAGWRTPKMYLDPGVQACMSGIALAEPVQLEEGLSRLRLEIESGEWKSKYGHLLKRETVDWGYRFLKVQ